MKTMIKALALATALTAFAGAAVAAEQTMKDCCAKCDCCDDAQKPTAQPGGEQQGSEHKH